MASMARHSVLTLGTVLAFTISRGTAMSMDNYENNMERKLFDDLISLYDGASRPVLKANTTIYVNFSMSLYQILELLEKNQILITQVWLYEEWLDENLTWDPLDYDNIDALVVPSEFLWIPDLYIFNNADKGDYGFVAMNESRAHVHYNGKVTYAIPLIIKSACAMDVTYFPFDNQRCFIRFGSWVYDSSQLNLLKKEELDMSTFISHAEFELLGARLERELVNYDTFESEYPQITLYLHIKRKPVYYAYTILAPTLVLSLMSLASFLLPCDNGGKVGIGLTVFLSLYVLQLAIAENIPESNSLPLIGVFLTLVMTLNCVSLLFATLVINIKKKGERKPCPQVPYSLLVFCRLVLAKLTCTRYLTFYDLYDTCEGETITIHEVMNYNGEDREEIMQPLPSPHETEGTVVINRRARNASSDALVDEAEEEELCTQISKRQSVKKKRKRPLNDPRYEWFFVAQVVDKFLFMIFLIGLTLTITVSLIIVPWIHYYD